MLIVSWQKSGELPQTKEYPDDRLQELMDRANATFGDPSRDLTTGPVMSKPSDSGLEQIQKQPPKKSSKR